MIEIDWIKIPGGDFLMGLSVEQCANIRHGVLEDERPQRPVEVPTFYIARYPITSSQFWEFVQDGHPEWELPLMNDPERANHPVYCHWPPAMAFCMWIGGRLPSSAEWEKAARGTDGRLYPWGEEWNPHAGNFGQGDRRGEIDGRKSSPVNAYPEGSSPYGVCDMMGNGNEWTITVTVVGGNEGGYQGVIARGSYDTDVPEKNRVTISTVGATGLPSIMYTSVTFRPVLDEWQYQRLQGTWRGSA